MASPYKESITFDEWMALEIDTETRQKFHISNFANDGFVKVCDVDSEMNSVYDKASEQMVTKPFWFYKNIDQSVMFDEHRSWVYFIVADGYIVKHGETGNPLGIAEQRTYNKGRELQPASNTKSRFGRIRRHDCTDENIRDKLEPMVKKGLVSLWAKKCPIIIQQTMIAGKLTDVVTSSHKSIEDAYLRGYFTNYVGALPILNKANK